MNKRQIKEAIRLHNTVKFCAKAEQTDLVFWAIDWVTSNAELDYEPPIYVDMGQKSPGIYVDFDSNPNKKKYREFRDHPANDTPLAVLTPIFVEKFMDNYCTSDCLLRVLVEWADVQKRLCLGQESA